MKSTTMLRLALFTTAVSSTLHHFFVGTRNGQALYSLEMNDEARTVYSIQARDASGASPSLVLDSSRNYLFTSRPVDGTVTRYSYGSDYALLDQGTTSVPDACNTTSFVSLHLTSAIQNAGIWGSASTGTCSVLFGLTIDGYAQMRSKEFAGDIHSLAWGANGRNLQALDSHSSTGVATSIVNFRISEDPNLGDIIATYVLVNVTDAAQIVSHPNGKRVYIVTNGTNELVTIQVQDRTNASKNAEILSRYKLLPSSLDASQFRSSSLAITAKNNTLWTFSQSPTQAVVTVFRLDSATGDVIEATARAGWSGSGDGQITAAPFESDHVVAITNSPLGYVTLLGLDQSRSTPAQDAWATHNHAYLDQLDMGSDLTTNVSLAAAKIKSYGRTVLDEFIALGESVWVD